MAYKLFSTAANFRAMREMCGITQQETADAMGVRILTVKRWEKGDTPLPDDALEWMRGCMSSHVEAVDSEVERMTSMASPPQAVCLTYYRTQEQADLDAGLMGGEAAPFQYINAIYRSVGERLNALGYLVSYKYPNEERIEAKRPRVPQGNQVRGGL